MGARQRGGWTCSGVRRIAPNSTIDIRIAAIEESSIARKALAETSYRLFACEFPYKPVVKNTLKGDYYCYSDPADRTPSWDDSEYERLTRVSLTSYDGETVLGYAPKIPDCGPDISHEIAVVFADGLMTPENVISEMRRVHKGVSISSQSSRCYLSGTGGPLVKFQLHGVSGRRKIFIINYATRHFYKFENYSNLEKEIESALSQTGHLADECSEQYLHKLIGYFIGKKSVSAKEIIKSIESSFSQKSKIHIECFNKDALPNYARFKYTAIFNANQVIEIQFHTDGINKRPDYDALIPEIEGRIVESGIALK